MKEVPYTLLFVLTFFCLTSVTVLLDFIQQKIARKYYHRVIEESKTYMYIHIFKTLAEISLLWLIVSFIGQVWMGWISF